MKVCFFNRSYWPDQAATGQLLTELAEDLVSRYGTEVTVVAGRALNASRAEAASGSAPGEPRDAAAASTSGAPTAAAFARRRFAARASQLPQLLRGRDRRQLQRLGRPDVVVSLTDPPILGLAALWAARRTGARFVFLCEDIFPEVAALLEDFHNSAVNGALDRINRYLLRARRRDRRARRSHAAAPGRGEGRRSRRASTSSTTGPTATRSSPGPKDNAFSREHGLADRFVLMHSGNVGLSQNLDVLIEAADRLRSKERLTIAIVGDGVRSAAARGAWRRRAG